MTDSRMVDAVNPPRAAEPAPDAVVLTQRIGVGVAVVSLNRPAKRNAVNFALARALSAAVEDLEADCAVRAVLLRSSTAGFFCAGADLAEVASGRTDFVTPDGRFAGFVRKPRRKPWIAVVDGPAVAGGCEIALACEMIVASRRSSFGVPEVLRGLMALEGGLQRLPRRLPRNVAFEMIATGSPIGAERAWSLGLVNRLADADEVDNVAIELARTIAANAPNAVQGSIEFARKVADQHDEEIWAESLVLERKLTDGSNPEVAEGTRAFLEKRAPCWP